MLVTVSADLITNYEAGMPVSTDRPFSALQDTDGQPIIVSIGSDQRLYAIIRAPGSSTGWTQKDITPHKDGKAMIAVAFEAVQLSSGSMVIACSASEAQGSDRTEMFVTSILSNNLAAVEWDNFSQYWQARPFQAAQAKMTKIYMNEVQSSAVPLSLVALEQNGQAKYYQLNLDLKDPSWVWRENTIPENATQILELALGQQRGYPGVYGLYDTADGRSLQFTSFPIYQKPFSGKTFSVFFQQPYGNLINSFQVLPSGSSSDNVYAAGDGIYLFSKGAVSPTVTISKKDELPTVHTLLARQDAAMITLWMVCGDNKLAMTTSPLVAQNSWQPPLLIKDKVKQIAAMRSRKYNANQLFLVSADDHLNYIWQDPGTTQWSETLIPLSDTGNTLSFDCYTTHIAFRDNASSQPVTDIGLKLSSSAWGFIKANGEDHALSDGFSNPISIKPDVMGTVTIINRVSTISTPTFEITVDGFDGMIALDPSSKAMNALTKIQSGDDLRAVTLPDGNKLISSDTDKASVDNTALAIVQLTNLANKPPQYRLLKNYKVSTADSTQAPNQVALLRSHGEVRRNIISAANLSADYIWGLSFVDDKIAYYEGHQARTEIVENILMPAATDPNYLGSEPVHIMALNIGDIGNAIKSFAGDVLKAIESGLEKVAGFIVHVVGKVVEFVVEIGGKLLKFIVDTVETAVRAINWLFQKIKVFFEDLIKWLGFIFDWKDIIRTKKIIVNVINQGLELAKHKTGEAEAAVNKFFDGIENAIDRIGPVSADVASMNMRAEGESMGQKDPQANDFMDSAPGNFASYHIFHSGATNHSPTFALAASSNPLTAFLTEVVAPLAKDMVDMAFVLGQDLFNLFTDKNLTVENGLIKIGKDVLKQMIKLARTAVVGFLKVVESALDLIKGMLNATANIPILSSLYKLLSGGDAISLLDVFALLVAVPATMLYKVVSGKTPYPEGNTSGLDTMGYADLFHTLSQGSLQLSPNALLAKAAEANVSEKIYKDIGSCLFIIVDYINVLYLRPIQMLSSESMPLLPYVNLVISAVKFGSTFPVGVKGAIADLSYFFWGVVGSALIAGAIKTKAGKGEPLVGQAVAVWNIFTSAVQFILGGAIFTLQMLDSPTKTQIGLGVATLAETTMRSTSGILDSIGVLDEDKAISGLGLAIAATIVGLFAVGTRIGRTCVQINS